MRQQSSKQFCRRGLPPYLFLALDDEAPDGLLRGARPPAGDFFAAGFDRGAAAGRADLRAAFLGCTGPAAAVVARASGAVRAAAIGSCAPARCRQISTSAARTATTATNTWFGSTPLMSG